MGIKPEAVHEQINNLLAKKNLGGSLTSKIKILQEMLKDKGTLPLSMVLKTLWQDKEEKEAAAYFRNFKDKLNKEFIQNNISLQLLHHQDNRPLREKSVWFEDEQEENINETVRNIARRQKKEPPDTPSSLPMAHSVSTEIECVRFPLDLENFAKKTAPDEWGKLLPDEQNFLKNLSVKLEPIIQIAPAPPIHFVLGFELLGFGPKGESFPAIVERIPEGKFNTGLVRLMLALAGLKTVEALRSEAGFEGNHGAKNLLFTVNLDPFMIESPHLTDFLEVYANLLDNVVFEIHEETKIKHIEKIKKLILKFDLKFALDDINDLSPEVRKALESRAELSKLDWKTFSNAMEHIWRNEEEAVKTIAGFRIHEQPLVVEGLSDETEQRVLARNWEKHNWGQLYGQGFNVEPGKPWEAWLSPLKDFGLPGGHILSSPLLAKANRILSDFMGPEARSMHRENQGDFFIFKLPGKSLGCSKDLVLALI